MNIDSIIFNWEDLDGKEGEIFVGVDKASGVDYTCVMFRDKDGHSYLIHAARERGGYEKEIL